VEITPLPPIDPVRVTTILQEAIAAAELAEPVLKEA
jgi:hypothetical protein